MNDQERAVMQKALEALDAMKAEFRALDLPYGSKAYAAGNQAAHGLRAALAQQEQEQDAEAWVDKGSIAWLAEQRSLQRRKVRSRREWQPLPACKDKPHAVLVDGYGYVDARAVRAIEAALKEKNA